MTAAQKYRPRAEVEALQWLGDDWGEHTGAMLDFTDEPMEGARGQRMVRTLFMALPSDDADDILGRVEALNLRQAGYTAVVYNDSQGRWMPVSTGDWIIKGANGAFFPWPAEKFDSTYELVAQP